jgi:hypothetical protein
MPYADNSAFEVVSEGPPKVGPGPTVVLLPYNRLLVVIDAQGVTGSVSFEGSIDNVSWYDLTLVAVADPSRKVDVQISLTNRTKPIAFSMMLQDSATAYMRLVGVTGLTGGTLSVKARKENS